MASVQIINSPGTTTPPRDDRQRRRPILGCRRRPLGSRYRRQNRVGHKNLDGQLFGRVVLENGRPRSHQQIAALLSDKRWRPIGRCSGRPFFI